MAVVGGEPAEAEEAFKEWRQGDATLEADLEFTHLADLTRPLAQPSIDAAAALDIEPQELPTLAVVAAPVAGFVVLTQTCDIVRDATKRSYVEVAPLVAASAQELSLIRKMKLPNRAYVPGVADKSLVADLDRTMTIEKPVLSRWTRIAGCRDDGEIRALQEALKRKRGRFAFPDDFELAIQKLGKRLADRAGKASPEGQYVDALAEIRVRAIPSWTAAEVKLEFWLIKDHDPPTTEPGKPDGNEWPKWRTEWEALFELGGRFTAINTTVSTHDYLTARDYIESDHLDLDRLSIDR